MCVAEVAGESDTNIIPIDLVMHDNCGRCLVDTLYGRNAVQLEPNAADTEPLIEASKHTRTR